MKTPAKISNIELFSKTAKKLGLTVTPIPTEKNKNLCSISLGNKFYFLSSKAPGFYPNAKRWGAHLTGSKQLTQKMLTKLGYKTIRSNFLAPSAYTSFTAFFAQTQKVTKKFPVILKPDDGLDGRGIKYVANNTVLKREMKTFYLKNTTVIIQPIITDPEYRILIINKKVELVHSKDFRSIVGDGTQTIASLLSHIPAKNLNVDFISMQYSLTGYTSTSILPEGIQFPYHIVKDSSATHYQYKSFPKALTSWANKLVTDLSIDTFAIDLFVKADLKDPSGYTIIELNSNPGLAHYYYACNDTVQPDRICNKVLRTYFGLK